MTRTALALILLALTASGARAQEHAQDAVPDAPFKEGDVLGYEQVDKLRSYLPEQFWEHREFFFYEGMQIEIGPKNRDYGEAKVFRDAL